MEFKYHVWYEVGTPGAEWAAKQHHSEFFMGIHGGPHRPGVYISDTTTHVMALYPAEIHSPEPLEPERDCHDCHWGQFDGDNGCPCVTCKDASNWCPYKPVDHNPWITDLDSPEAKALITHKCDVTFIYPDESRGVGSIFYLGRHGSISQGKKVIAVRRPTHYTGEVE